jgi:hypothetical protein
MAILSSVTPYATIAQADAVNGTDEPWASATDAVKNASLVNATLYINAEYQCTLTDPVQQNVVEACSVLANIDIDTPLFQVDTTTPGNVSAEAVAAGSVSSSKSYSVNPGSSTKDPFPEVTALLGQAGVCSYGHSGMVSVTR